MMPSGILFRADRASDYLFWLFATADARSIVQDDRDEDGFGTCVVSPFANPEPEPQAKREREPVRSTIGGSTNHKAFLATFRALTDVAPKVQCEDGSWKRGKARNAQKRARQALQGKR